MFKTKLILEIRYWIREILRKPGWNKYWDEEIDLPLNPGAFSACASVAAGKMTVRQADKWIDEIGLAVEKSKKNNNEWVEVSNGYKIKAND